MLRRRRAHPVGRTLVLAAGVAMLAAACSTSPDATVASSTTAAAVTGPGGDGAPRPGSSSATTGATTAGATRTKLEGFHEVTVTVVDAEGRTRTFCLLLADSEPLRQQGLMRVSDPSLGGYDGMVFSWPSDVSGGFWMKNTLLPLSIAYVRADGSTVSTTDMVPCPADASTCPSYPSGGPYRFAIEVPQGQLSRLGIDDRSRVTLGERSCA